MAAPFKLLQNRLECERDEATDQKNRQSAAHQIKHDQNAQQQKAEANIAQNHRIERFIHQGAF
jgi:hypothetical protein